MVLGVSLSLIFSCMLVVFPGGACLLWAPGPLNPQSLGTNSPSGSFVLMVNEAIAASTSWFPDTDFTSWDHNTIYWLFIQYVYYTWEDGALFLQSNIPKLIPQLCLQQAFPSLYCTILKMTSSIFWMVQYVVGPTEPMVTGPPLHLLSCEVSHLLSWNVMLDALQMDRSPSSLQIVSPAEAP